MSLRMIQHPLIGAYLFLFIWMIVVIGCRIIAFDEIMIFIGFMVPIVLFLYGVARFAFYRETYPRVTIADIKAIFEHSDQVFNRPITICGIVETDEMPIFSGVDQEALVYTELGANLDIGKTATPSKYTALNNQAEQMGFYINDGTGRVRILNDRPLSVRSERNITLAGGIIALEKRILVGEEVLVTGIPDKWNGTLMLEPYQGSIFVDTILEPERMRFRDQLVPLLQSGFYTLFIAILAAFLLLFRTIEPETPLIPFDWLTLLFLHIVSGYIGIMAFAYLGVLIKPLAVINLGFALGGLIGIGILFLSPFLQPYVDITVDGMFYALICCYAGGIFVCLLNYRRLNYVTKDIK